MKKLLIAGGSHSDIPLILAAKKLGYFVITTGTREEDLGHQYSDKYIKADYSNMEQIVSIAIDEKVDALCPCCNDFSAITCSYVAEKLGFKTFDTLEVTRTIHYKNKFREFMKQYNFPSPVAANFDNVEDALQSIEALQLPLIVKPVDLTGGKGISRIATYDEAKQAIIKALSISRQKKIVIEEFIDGSYHGLSVFLKNKKVAFYFFDNEYYYLNKYLVAGAYCPGSVPKQAIQQLCAVYQKMAEILSLHDGIFHTQFILKDDKPYITEICRRPPGDLYLKLVEYATGIPYSEYIVRAFAGLDITGIQQSPINGNFIRHCIMPNKCGIVKKIVYSHEINNNILEKFEWYTTGETVTDYLTHKFGIIFLKFDSYNNMVDCINSINELIKVEME